MRSAGSLVRQQIDSEPLAAPPFDGAVRMLQQDPVQWLTEVSGHGLVRRPFGVEAQCQHLGVGTRRRCLHEVFFDKHVQDLLRGGALLMNPLFRQ